MPKIEPRLIKLSIAKAEQGDPRAQFEVGMWYLGQPLSQKQAYEWFRRSADGGFRTAMVEIGFLLINQPIETDDSKVGQEWLEKAISLSCTDAMVILSDYLLKGNNADKVRGFNLLTEAGNKDNSDAALKLADAYMAGEQVEKDYKSALQWYERASEAGIPHAQVALSRLYANARDLGLDSQNNYEKAFFWLLVAKKSGYIPAAQAIENLKKLALDQDYRAALREAARWKKPGLPGRVAH